MRRGLFLRKKMYFSTSFILRRGVGACRRGRIASALSLHRAPLVIAPKKRDPKKQIGPFEATRKRQRFFHATNGPRPKTADAALKDRPFFLFSFDKKKGKCAFG